MTHESGASGPSAASEGAVTGPSSPDAAPQGRSKEAGALSSDDLVACHGDMVFRLAMRLTGDREEARDLAQDAFVRILRGAASYRGEASLKTWICQVVINCHRNRMRWWRRLKRGNALSLDQPVATSDHSGDVGPTLGDRLADPAPGPDRDAEAEEIRRRIEEELARLPTDQRAALVMREIEGMSYSEIAAALGVREGTVKSRLSRGREALRLALADLVEKGSP